MYLKIKIFCTAKKKPSAKRQICTWKKVFATYHKRILSLTIKSSSKYVKKNTIIPRVKHAQNRHREYTEISERLNVTQQRRAYIFH